MEKRWIIISLAVLLVVTAAGLGGNIWRRHVIVSQRQKVRDDIEHLIAQGRLREARVGVQLFLRQNARGLPPAEQSAWNELDVRVSEELRDVARLLWHYDRQPQALLTHEQASLTVLRALATINQGEAADRFRAQWRSHERHAELWAAYDADRLIATGRRDEAIALLEGLKFEGTADSSRLIRLALLHYQDGAKAADLMQRAFAADPRNPDLRTYRGQILESTGRFGLARVEYVAALLARPGDPLLRDQLAEYYVRIGNLPLATSTWRDGLGPEMPDFLWLKSAFWERVAFPRPGSAPACPPGPLEPAVNFLRQLPPSRFFEAAAFASLRDARRLASERQELFWLQVLQDLADGRETEALDRIESRGFRGQSWDPELQSVLRIVLKFRLTQRTPVPGDFNANSRLESRHLLFEQIERWTRSAVEDPDAMPADTQAFLAGPQAFAGVLFAAGWVEAGLRLAQVHPAPPDAPEWYRFAEAQALRLNRDAATALAYVQRQPAAPVMELLRGELLFALQRPAEAVTALGALARRPADTGLRAAWLLAVYALERNAPAECTDLVEGNPQLAASPRGAELLARAALARNDVAAAARYYAAAADDSLEAGVFLSRLAFQRKDWAEARRLTEALVQRYPDELQLQANLEAVARAERGGRP
jgi:Flp pilus assembly protein TadD